MKSLMKFHFLDSEHIHDFHLPCNFTSHIETEMESLGRNENWNFFAIFLASYIGHYQYYRSLRHYHYRPIENLPLINNLSITKTSLHCKEKLFELIVARRGWVGTGWQHPGWQSRHRGQQRVLVQACHLPDFGQKNTNPTCQLTYIDFLQCITVQFILQIVMLVVKHNLVGPMIDCNSELTVQDIFS